MDTLSVAQMREADRRAIEDLGIPGAVLMNNAGAAVFAEVRGPAVGIVCGKGNNGGDGFVVARLALLAGFQTEVVLLGEPDDLTGDAATFMKAYTRLGGAITVAMKDEEVATAVLSLAKADTLVDAILGTGTAGTIRGLPAAAIDHWPERYTVAVDVPSGLHADTGSPCGSCIRADATVTFQFAKTGFTQPEAQPYLGSLIVADIGIPAVCGDDEAWAKLINLP
jgi:NAD(P)H-hydrate epimerase